MVGAAVVPRGWTWPGLRDSKEMSDVELERVAGQLWGHIFVHVERMLVREFEEFGPGPALRETHQRAAQVAIRHLGSQPNALVIIDGKNELYPGRAAAGITCRAEVNADDHVPAVMAAAICAKVTRDRYMRGLHHMFPTYNWHENAGYAGRDQIQTIKQRGGTSVHRRNYNPLKTMLAEAHARRQLTFPFPNT
jgi:ribonuclease HII